MTPKEEARELVLKYWNTKVETQHVKESIMSKELAKQCALIAVEEIIEAITFNTYDEEAFNEENDFWHSVKEEIENL